MDSSTLTVGTWDLMLCLQWSYVTQIWLAFEHPQPEFYSETLPSRITTIYLPRINSVLALLSRQYKSSSH